MIGRFEVAGAGIAVRWNARRLARHGVVFVALLVVVGVCFRPRVVDLRASGPREGYVPTPFSWPGPARWLFEATIGPGLRPLDHLTIRADDCVDAIRVDGRTIYESPCPAAGHWTPTRFPLPPLDAAVAHRLSVRLHNEYGVALFSLRQAAGPGARTLGILLFVGLAWLSLVARLRRPAWVFWSGALALVAGELLYEASDPWLRQHDIGGHREYIAFLLREHALPPILSGWEGFQPPLYYLAAALASRVWEMTTWEDPARGMQALALAAYVATVMLAALFGSRRRRTIGGGLATALVALLPAHVLLATRINNDVLLPLLGALAVVALVAALETVSVTPLVVAGVSIAAAVATKASSLALLGATAAVLAANQVGLVRGRRLRLRHAAIVLLPGIVVAALSIARTLHETGKAFFTPVLLLGSGQVSPNGAWKFLSFDVVAAVTERSLDFGAGAVRHSLATSLAVSAAGGDFPFGWLGDPLGPVVVPSILAVVLLVVVGLVVPPGRRPSDFVPWLVSGAFLAFFWLYNFTSPYLSCQNARIVAPAFLPLALVATRGSSILAGLAPNRAAAWAVRLLPWPFLVASASLFVRLALW